MAIDYQYYEFQSYEYLVRLGQLWEGMEELTGVQELLGQIEKRMKEKYGPDSVKLSITQQYKNMAEVLRDKQDIVLRAERALKKQGLTPDIRPIRGGTDGSQLSFRGLPCPNLGTGGYGFHGPYEHISTAHMDTMVEVVLNLLGEK